MNLAVEIDSKEFRAAAQALLQTSSRSTVDFVNGQMLFVASNAIKLTEKANREKIEHELGVVASTIKKRKSTGGKGWVRITNRILRPDSFAERILIKRHADTGKWLVGGKSLAQKAKNLISAKVRSIAFIKSGWIPSVRWLSSVVYRKPRIQKEVFKKVGMDKGKVFVANKSQEIPTCRIINTALNATRFSSWYGKAGNPMPVAEAGLRKAMDFATKDMMEELSRRLGQDLKPFNAK